jgi:hypothetical protein
VTCCLPLVCWCRDRHSFCLCSDVVCLQGFSRKLALRQVNRKIIARVARRFTIGIPVLGECSVC